MIVAFIMSANSRYSYAEWKKDKDKICTSLTYDSLWEGMDRGEYQALINFVMCSHNDYGAGNHDDLSQTANTFILKNPAIYLYILEKEDVPISALPIYFLSQPYEIYDDKQALKDDLENKLKALKATQQSEIRDKAIALIEGSLIQSYGEVKADGNKE